jgi:uncharacterized protein YwqG
MLTRRCLVLGSAAASLSWPVSCNQQAAQMTGADFHKRLATYDRPFARMDMTPGDPGQEPITKLSGAPWWPSGKRRPVCVDGHGMAFIAQIRLDQVPGFRQPPTLLSFHYCDECAYRGKMAWGWADERSQSRYNLSLFSDVDGTAVDRLGVVTKASVAPQTPTFHNGVETLSIEDIWERFPETARPNGIPDFEAIIHENRSKLGGWPSWVQHPSRPKDQMGREMGFVGQLDLHACPESAWANGYAYLFASIYSKAGQIAELVIQTT